MHIAIVDSNPAALRLIRLAKQSGHRVTYLQPSDPQYELSDQNRRIVAEADRLIDGVATTDPDEVRAVIAACHAEDPIDIVTTQQELAVEAVATTCRALGLHGTAPEGALLARRKDLCRAALRDAGLPYAAFATATTTATALAAAERIGYPVVLKPPSGAASLLARVVHDRAQAEAACAALLGDLQQMRPDWREQLGRGILVEERLTGPLVSVEIGRRGDEFSLFCISGRFRWHRDEVVELGSYLPAELTPEQAAACTEYAQAVCRAIGADHGLFHLEMILTERSPVLVEFNPRVMGGGLPNAYRHATGDDIHAAALEIITGRSPVGVPRDFDRTTAVCVLIAEDAGRISPDASLDSLEREPDVCEVINFAAYHTGPGRAVAPGQVLGRFVLRAADRTAIVERMAKLLEDTGRRIGVRLMTGDVDTLRRSAGKN